MTDINSATQDQLSQSINAVLLLNSSCQAIVESYITPSDSPWYSPVANELHNAQVLVRQWRLSGYLYFNQSILTDCGNCAAAILAARTTVEQLFAALTQQFTEQQKQQLVAALQQLVPVVTSLNSSVGTYQDKLNGWSLSIAAVHAQLNNTIGQIQQQAAEIEADIQAANQIIASMQQTIEQDRQALAKAKAAESKGIVETIFGVLLAPITGGASLILAGIGVASIVEGEAEITALQSNISSAQQQIVTNQAHLSDDQKQIASLQGIGSSANLVISDVNFIGESLDALRTQWQLLRDNLLGVISKITQAENAAMLVLSKVWFEAACNEWAAILQFVRSMQNAGFSTSKVSIQTLK